MEAVGYVFILTSPETSLGVTLYLHMSKNTLVSEWMLYFIDIGVA